MGNQLYTFYYKNKLKTFYQYATILDKIFTIDDNKLWENIKERDKIFRAVIEIYFAYILTKSIPDKKYLQVFVDFKKIRKYELDNEINSVIQYFINNKKALDIDKYQNEIILLAIILKLTNNFDIITSPYYKIEESHLNYVNSKLKEYSEIDFITFNEDLDKRNLLIELIKTNLRKEKKIFSYLTDLKSFNSFVDISKKDNIYLTQYSYSIISLDNFDHYATERAYKDGNYSDDFVLVSADLIVSSLLKIISFRGKYKYFLLPITSESFFKNNKTINKFNNIYKINIVKKYLRVLINYEFLNEDIINTLKKHQISYYAFCDKDTIKIDKLNKKIDNYHLSKEYVLNNKNYKEIFKEKHIIVEDYNGIIDEDALLILE